MDKRLLIGLFSLITFEVHAQSGWDNFFYHDTLTDKHLGTFVIHASKSNRKAAKPLLVYLDGSGNYPLFYRKNNGKYNTSVSLDIARYAKDYTIVLISKPGIPFSDSLRYRSGKPYYPENRLFDQLYSLQWRAGTASKAIDYLYNKLPVDKKHIIVMGYSEGSQVAPAVAVLNKRVTHVICFVGNALNQLYDFIIEQRLNADRNAITAEKAQHNVDSLYDVYQKIYNSPDATDKKWFGATHLKWSSFSVVTPLENMLKLDIPILYIAGGKDNNQTIIDMDYARLEFLRKHKTNLTYKVYPNSNHYLQEGETDHSDEAHQFALDWVNENY